MPKRSRKSTPEPADTDDRPTERGPDANETGFAAVQAVIEAMEGSAKDPIAVMLGRRGGLKGGRARADKLTKEQRIASARKAAQARWSKYRPESETDA